MEGKISMNISRVTYTSKVQISVHCSRPKWSAYTSKSQIHTICTICDSAHPVTYNPEFCGFFPPLHLPFFTEGACAGWGCYRLRKARRLYEFMGITATGKYLFGGLWICIWCKNWNEMNRLVRGFHSFNFPAALPLPPRSEKYTFSFLELKKRSILDHSQGICKA